MGEKRYDYITPEDYETGGQNGLSRDLIYQRVHSYGWDVDRAITTPKHKRTKTKWSDWESMAVVSYDTFRHRIRDGWPHEKAALTPKILPTDNRNSIITPEIKARAEANGITPGALKQRIYNNKWDIEKAVTVPLMNKTEAAKLAAAAKYGRYRKGEVGKVAQKDMNQIAK